MWVVRVGGRDGCGVISFEGVSEGIVGVFMFGCVVFGPVVKRVSLVDFIRVLLWFIVGHRVVRLLGLREIGSTWVRSTLTTW